MQTYEIKVSLDAGPSIVYQTNFDGLRTVMDHVEHMSVYGVWGYDDSDTSVLYPSHRIMNVEVKDVTNTT